MYAQSHAERWTQEYDLEDDYTQRLTHALLAYVECYKSNELIEIY